METLTGTGIKLAGTPGDEVSFIILPPVKTGGYMPSPLAGLLNDFYLIFLNIDNIDFLWGKLVYIESYFFGSENRA